MQWVIDPTASAWIGARRDDFLASRVTSLIPRGYEAYARIPREHRCESAGLLVEALRADTAPDERCWFAEWEGYGWVWGGVITFGTDPARHGLRPRDDELPVPRHVRDGARAPLPHRDYVLYTGALDDALALTGLDDASWLARAGSRLVHDDVPDLWWPESRTWFVGSDTDLDHCTHLGGPRALVDRVLAEADLGAHAVDPADPLV